MADWVDANQAHPQGHNRWPEFVDASGALGGMWDYFTLSSGPIAAYVAEDPDNNWRATDPVGLVNDPVYAKFGPELRAFFATLDRSAILFRLDELTGPARFVALRATEPLIETAMPELGRARLAAKICAARMRVMLVDRRPDQAVRSLAHALALGNAATGRGSLIAHMVAQACWTVAEHEVRIDLLDGRLEGSTCRDMLAVLSAARPPETRVALGGERCFVLDMIDRYFAQEGEEAKRAAGAREETSQSNPARSVGVPRDDQVRLANEFFRAAGGLWAVDKAERERASVALAAVMATLQDRASGRDYRPLSMALPDLNAAQQADKRLRLAVGGLRTMLALRVYREREGRYPERLEQLVPIDLDAVPMDPFSDGVPLGYRVIAASELAPEKAYVLTSVRNDTGPGTAGGSEFILNARDW